MAEPDPRRRTVGDSLRQYVLSSLSDAQSLPQKEHKEVETEIQAFKQFKKRVNGIQTVPPPSVRPKKECGFVIRSQRGGTVTERVS